MTHTYPTRLAYIGENTGIKTHLRVVVDERRERRGLDGFSFVLNLLV